MSSTPTPSLVSDTSTVESPFYTVQQYADLNVSFSREEINLIRVSWNAMKDDPSAHEKACVQGTASAFFCQQFYDNLLGEFPELKVLFPSLKAQSSSLAGIFSLVISQLDNLPRVVEILVSLGKRHSRIIGVDVIHYELIGIAFMKTLQDRFGDAFTLEHENAWIKLYAYISNIMLQAGEDPPAPKNSQLGDDVLDVPPMFNVGDHLGKHAGSDTSGKQPGGFRKAPMAKPSSNKNNPAPAANGAENKVPSQSFLRTRIRGRKTAQLANGGAAKKDGNECLIM